MIEVLIGIIFGLLVLVPLTLTIWLLVYAAQAATAWVGTCRRCGYDLRHLPADRHCCPECGQPFHLNARGDPIS